MIPTIYPVTDSMRLRVLKTEKFKVGLLSVSAVLPIKRESVYMTTLLLSVLRRGTVKYPTLAAINRRLDYLYGAELSIRNFYRGDSQIVGFSAELIDASYLPDGEDPTAEVLDVMREILFHPLLDENGLLDARYVESEKKLQCDAIRATKNNPRGYAVERFGELMFAAEPCGAPVYGTEEEVMAVTAESLTSYWRELIETLTLECFYVGGADADRLASCLKQAFGEELRAPLCDSPVQTKVIRKAVKVTRADEDLEVAQGHLLLGFRTGTSVGEPDSYACAVLNELLGSSPVSKLFVNVRERLSLCYSCSSTYNAFKGTVQIYCGLKSENRAVAEAEILRQLDAIKAGEFDEAELEAAKKSLLNVYRQLEDSATALESFYFGRALIGSLSTAEDSRRAFAYVSREAVIAAAHKLQLDTVYFLNGTLAGEEAFDDEED